MEQYIYCVVATKILIKKTKAKIYEQGRYSFKTILDKINPFFDLSLYDIEEDEYYVELNMKESILEQYLYDFLKEQSHYLFKEDQMRAEIEKLKGKNGYEILHMLLRCEFEYIHYYQSDVFKQDYYLKDCHSYVEGISFLSEGKASMDFYDELFLYVHYVIRNGFCNRLKDAVCLKLS